MDKTRRLVIALTTFLVTVAVARTAAAQPCLIFVHGKRTNTGTYTNWNEARSYWQNGSDDFVRTATNNFATSYYVVGYNGTKAYWDAQSAGEVATEIVNATNGGNDGGGNHCARTWAQGGTFWVIAHSMGPSVVDYILGNSDPSDPNYDLNGPYDLAAQRLALAISIAGTHRGSQLADNVCGGGNIFCQIAGLVQDCDDATYWIRTSDDVQVRTYSGTPARNVYLTGGYAAIFGPSACLAGEDDGLVQHASAYACNGSPSTGYDNSNVCNDANKMESSGFHNLDTAHENHDEERNDSHRHTRQAIPTGLWSCGGAPCSADSTVQSNLSTAQLVSRLYAVPTSANPCPAGSSSASGNQPCLYCFPGTFAANAGATSCTPCAAGTRAVDAGATSCPACPAGTYAPGDGASACLTCPADTFSTGTATACTPCPPGTSAPEGSSTCAPDPTTTTSSSSSTSSTSTTSPTSSSSSSSSTSSTSSSTSTSTSVAPSTTTTTLPPPCGPSPATGCHLTTPGSSSLQVKHLGAGRDQLAWKWNKGETAIELFGDPRDGSATYQVCLYDASGNAQPLLVADVLPGSTCGTRPCWRASSTGFTYRNRAGDPDGIIALTLKAGLPGKAKVQAKAKGANLQTPTLPLLLPITAQLVIDDGASRECWQATFSTTVINDTFRVRATGP